MNNLVMCVCGHACIIILNKPSKDMTILDLDYQRISKFKVNSQFLEDSNYIKVGMTID